MAESIINKAKRRISLELAYRMSQNWIEINKDEVYISFTFDDFFHSAWVSAREILGKRGYRGTFYASESLLGNKTELGELYSKQDVAEIIELGHEIGCHTKSHISALKTRSKDYFEDVCSNNDYLKALTECASIESFAYPFGEITTSVKKQVAGIFSSCRIIKGNINRRRVDLNMVKAFPLMPARASIEDVKALLQNCVGSWIVFYTHDITDSHTKYGCSPSYFEEVLAEVERRHYKVLPVKEVVRQLRDMQDKI